MKGDGKYYIGYFQGHYIVVDKNGNVIAHCDSYEECEQEIEEEEANNVQIH